MTIFEFTLWGFRIAPTYYGLAYALGFLWAHSWIRRRKKFTENELDTLLYCIVAGIIIGGRLGYVFFYNFSYYLAHPLKALAVWEGGMSFHGGIIGVTVAILLFGRFMKKNIWFVADEVAVTVPFGIFFGRIANYLNNELVGYAGYSWPFAMLRNGVGHFPSPLVEAMLEWLALGAVLWHFQRKNPKNGVLAGMFLTGYAMARIVSEVCFRMPDAQIGYLAGGFSLGSWLSFFVLWAWILILFRFGRQGGGNNRKT